MFQHHKQVILLSVITVLTLLVACQAAPSAPLPTAPSIPPSPTAPSPTDPPGYVTPDVVDSSEVTFSSGNFDVKAYLSRPRASGSFAGLIIIHENRGLTDHIRDVARLYANQGYVALAPDLLSRVGGTARFATTNDTVAAIGTLSREGTIEDLNSAFKYLETLPFVNRNRIGVLGYCWGGRELSSLCYP